MSYIDLHIHTTASDGTDSPRAAVEKAAALGLAAVSITDHDSVSGVPEAMRAGAELGVEVVPGIEVSSDYRDNNVHILGYFIDPAAPQLRPVLDWVKTERDERNEKIAAMFERDGFDISLAQLREEYPDSVLGRPHFCEHLMRKGYISSVKEGFEKYLGEGKPYYLPKRRISIAKAVETIVAAGGVPVLAHGGLLRISEVELNQWIDSMAKKGLMGLECYHNAHTPQMERLLRAAAERNGLLVTGGSDFHGASRPDVEMGTGLSRWNDRQACRGRFLQAVAQTQHDLHMRA